MFCNQCGKQIPDDSEFCRFCGSRLAASRAISTNVISNAEPEKTPSKVVVECNPHWTLAYKPLLIGILAIILGIGVHPLFLVIAVGAFVYYYIFMKNVRLCLTNDSIIGKKGIINTQRMTSPIRNVQDLSVSDGLFGKLLGYSDIIISTAGTSRAEYIFKKMTNCKKFQQEFIRIQGGMYR